jgi:hypothetical protein
MKRQKAIPLESDNSYNNFIRSVSKIIKSEATQDGEGVTLNR